MSVPRLHVLVRKLTDTVELQRNAIAELFHFSSNAHSIINNLGARVVQLEGGINSDIASCVAQLDNDFMSIGAQFSGVERTVTPSNALSTIDSSPGKQNASRDVSVQRDDLRSHFNNFRADCHSTCREQGGLEAPNNR